MSWGEDPMSMLQTNIPHSLTKSNRSALIQPAIKACLSDGPAEIKGDEVPAPPLLAAWPWSSYLIFLVLLDKKKKKSYGK